tara:strand:- start:180 stop:1052 length:873 start_codon:yes stop_codon:yes gene_type:complete
MHVNIMRKIFLLKILIFLMFTSSLYSQEYYYKCPEVINNLISDENNLFSQGNKIGDNIIKLNKDNYNSKIDIHFLNFKNNSINKIFKNKNVEVTTLGFDVENKINNDSMIQESVYSFLEIGNEYAFTRKEFFWNPSNDSSIEIKYEYESSGRCKSINKIEYQKILKIQNNENIILEEENKKKKDVITNNQLSGERTFALSWEGYEELILGSLIFNEENLIGNINFDLPKNDGSCLGTYVLSKGKGTWSLRCDKDDMNASGLLDWNLDNGTVVGQGKDNKDRKVKFKVASK